MQLWMEMYEAPSEGEAEMVEEVLKSWFMVGRLGGFNGMNLQVGLPGARCSSRRCWCHVHCVSMPSTQAHSTVPAAVESAGLTAELHVVMRCTSSQVFNNAAEEGASFLEYDAEECETGLDALFHDMSNTERNGSWLRTWWVASHRQALTGCRLRHLV